MNPQTWLEAGQSRKYRRRQQRLLRNRRFNLPPEPAAAPAGGPAPVAPNPVSPPPAAAPSTPASPEPSSAVGPGTSGLPTPGATPAAAAPAPVAAPESFEQQIRKQFGMDPAMLRTMATMGYQQYQRSGQPAPAPAAPATPEAKKNPFGLPEFDNRLLDYVQRGPNGLEMLPGAPPDALMRVREYQDQLVKAQQQFFQDPSKFLGEMIREEAKKQAADIYKEQFGGYQAQTAAQKIVQENEGWLFEKGADGRPLTQYDPAQGREVQVMSPWGRLYSTELQNAASAGVSDINAQHQFALRAVENIAMRQRLAANGAPAAGNAAATNFLNNAAGQPNQPAPAAPTPYPATPAGPSLSFRDRMAANFDASGLTDEVVRRQLNGG